MAAGADPGTQERDCHGREKKKGFREAVAECNGRPAAEFFDEMSRQAKEHFDHA